jgi:hypothetical protein
VDRSSFFSERRAKPRILCSYPAKVSGRDASGRAFDESTALDNLSSNGLFLHLRTEIPAETIISVIFRFSKTAALGQGKGPLIAVDGVVVRSQKEANGIFGVAVKIQNHRFL